MSRLDVFRYADHEAGSVQATCLLCQGLKIAFLQIGLDVLTDSREPASMTEMAGRALAKSHH